MTLLTAYWQLFAAHADAFTWLGVALIGGGLYLRHRVP
jgi:hypothetical protein